jgi:hypothetical protein
VATAPTLPGSQPIYRPRGPDPLRTLFRRRFSDFQAAYEQRYAATCGRFRLPLIARAASAFSPLGGALRRLCCDWSQGIARIRCPECCFDRFRPFSCKSCLLCPSCAQKRTLLVGEYLSENLPLTLPHRQFVWTIPKALRVFLRHDRELFADLGRLLFDIPRGFFCQAAGRSLRCAMVSSHQTFSEFHRAGGWLRPARRALLNRVFARKIPARQHSGFSIESGTRILDQSTREAPYQYE